MLEISEVKHVANNSKCSRSFHITWLARHECQKSDYRDAGNVRIADAVIDM